MGEMPLRVLVVDDDRNILRILIAGLESFDCTVIQAASAAAALTKLEGDAVDLVLTDVRMDGLSGIDLIAKAKRMYPRSIFVVMTAYASYDNAVAAIKAGAFDYLAKPFSIDQLGHLLGKVRRLVTLQRENEQLRSARSHPEFFSGYSSPALQRLEEMVDKIAPTDATVLITGESGTGKSEFARLVHAKSTRSEKSFVEVNCASLSETLLESELFGHQKGAFTGASQEKIGMLEVASGGTVFLDEVGELTPRGQTKLLRFLQERLIERVGATKSIAIDTRVIAATNKNLEEAVAQGLFREDLYYRLNIFECVMVPLRYRREDLPVLIKQMLERQSSHAGGAAPPVLSAEIFDLLIQYDWPGNLREMRNVMERLVILAAGRDVLLSDLPERLRQKPAHPVDPQGPLVSLKELELAHIKRVLAQEHNQERAAKILGITTVTLWRKRREFGLD